MRVHLLDLNDGVPNRGTAAILGLVEARGHDAVVYDVRRGCALPGSSAGPWILGGGPGSPLDDGPWRAPLLAAVEARVRAGLPTLGICFGFELMALAMGAQVGRLATPREGLHPVRLLPQQGDDPLLAHLDGAMAYEQRQWGVFGGEGTTVAMGPEGDRAAVRYGRAWGVIFHPEADFGDETRAVHDAVIPRFLAEAG